MYKSALVFLSLALTALAVDTRYWSQDAQSDFEKGRRKSLYGLYIKPAIKLISCYVFKLGFLDGEEGWIIAKMTAKGVLLRNKFLAELSASNKIKP